MKNTKGLLALTVALTVILVGCGAEPVHPIADVQPEVEDESTTLTYEEFTTNESTTLIHDDFVVHSNHVLNYEYMPNQNDFQEDRFEHVKTHEDALAVENSRKVIQSSLISEVSNALTKNPHEVSDSTHINTLKSDSTTLIPTRELITYRHLTSLIIIDKFDDAYINEHHAIEGVTDFMVQMDAYEENLENAESVEEIIVTLFENDQFVVKLAPSSQSLMSAGEFDNAQALDLLDEYVDYFKTPEVKSIIEDALGQKFQKKK